MVMVASKSMVLSAICGTFLAAVTIGAASAGSSSAGVVKKIDPNSIKDCNDTADACTGKAYSTRAKLTCKRNYSNCIGTSKF